MKHIITRTLVICMALALLSSCCFLEDDDNDLVLPGMNDHNQGASESA